MKTSINEKNEQKENNFYKKSNKSLVISKEEMKQMMKNVYKYDKENRIEKETKILAKT